MTLQKKYIEDKDGNVVLPITHQSAVLDDNGTPLTTIMEDFAYLGNDDGQAIIPGFDPEYDCVWNKPQTMSTLQKDNALSNIISKDSTNGMARVVLKATDDFKTVVEAQTGGNTIFVIQYDFVLTGDVTVPANCILEFEGGSISGIYTLTGQNTTIASEANKIFDTQITLDGSWKNTSFHGEWFGVNSGNQDNLAYINRAISNIPEKHCLTLGIGNYTISNTILIEKEIDLDIQGKIISAQSGSFPAIVMNLINDRNIYIHSIASAGKPLDYTEENNYNYSCGLVIKDCSNLKICIDNIESFSTGLFLFSKDRGTYYNNISVRRFTACFNGIKITDVDNGGGVNANKFFNSHFKYYSWNRQQIIDSGYYPYFVVSNSFASSGTPYYNNANSFENFTIEYNPSEPNEYNNPRIFKGTYVRGYTFVIDRIEVSSYSGDAYDAFNLVSAVQWCYFYIRFAWGNIAPLTSNSNKIIRQSGNTTSNNPQIVAFEPTYPGVNYKAGHVFVDTANMIVYISLVVYWTSPIAGGTVLIQDLPILKERSHIFTGYRCASNNFWNSPAIVETVLLQYNQVGALSTLVDLAGSSSLCINITFPY